MSDFESAQIFSRDGLKVYRIGSGMFGFTLQVYERKGLKDGKYIYEDIDRDNIKVFKSYEAAYDKLMELLNETQD